MSAICMCWVVFAYQKSYPLRPKAVNASLILPSFLRNLLTSMHSPPADQTDMTFHFYDKVTAVVKENLNITFLTRTPFTEL